VYIRRGRFFTPAEQEHRSQVAIVGSAIAETLFGALDPLEREIEVDGKIYHVIGVMEKARAGCSEVIRSRIDSS